MRPRLPDPRKFCQVSARLCDGFSEPVVSDCTSKPSHSWRAVSKTSAQFEEKAVLIINVHIVSGGKTVRENGKEHALGDRKDKKALLQSMVCDDLRGIARCG